MQAIALKKSQFFWHLAVFVLLAGQLSAQGIVSAGMNPIRRADSLFATGATAEAIPIYETAMATGQPATDAMLLKLAFAHEQLADVPKLLYYLEVYFDRHPSEAVLRKMNDIARANGLSGYETDDLNYFYLFYKQYGQYLVLLLLILGGYVTWVIVAKSWRNEATPTSQKWVTLFYLLGVWLFINLPEGYKSGIISRDRVLLRSAPSGAAPVVDVVGRGHKVNILGSQDIWLRVFWNNKLYYLRKDQVWII